MQPPPRRKFFQSVKSLLLNPLQVEAILCEGSCGHWQHRCAGLSKAAFARVPKSSSKFCCPLCCVGAQEKEIKALKSCVSELKSSVSKLESKLDSLMNSLSMTMSPLGMDPQQILWCILCSPEILILEEA